MNFAVADKNGENNAPDWSGTQQSSMETEDASVSAQSQTEDENSGQPPVVVASDVDDSFLSISAGTFMMGSPDTENWRIDDEKQHDVEMIRQKLLASDMVVFATPLYYYGMTAQLKTVVDRFCAYNSSLNSRHLKSVLLTVAWNADDWTFEALVSHYKTLVRYINFEDKGMVLGYGCGSPGMTGRSKYPQEAYQLGRSL